MHENPYQSPPPEPAESADTTHRSFRLTSGSTSADTPVKTATFRDALVFSLVLQLPLLLLSGMMLDGGSVFRGVVFASLAYWLLLLILLVRRGRKLSAADLQFVKWGFLPVLVLTPLLARLVSAIFG